MDRKKELLSGKRHVNRKYIAGMYKGIIVGVKRTRGRVSKKLGREKWKDNREKSQQGLFMYKNIIINTTTLYAE